MRKAITSELHARIDRVVAEFPELADETITVGLVMTSRAHGTADAREMVIRLNMRERSGMSHFTIAHELTHLLQSPGLGIVPAGETPCDIFALARSPLFTDDMPTYLNLPCTRRSWSKHAAAVRALCIQAIEIRKTRRTYIAWLNDSLDAYFNRAI